MRHATVAAFAACIGLTFLGHAAVAGDDYDGRPRANARDQSVQVGARPFYLVQGMDASALKSRLQKCQNGPFRRTKFSIAHRGAPLQFPEHTQESYEAGARMGAGIVECDVTFTKDGQLVCRHDECDLHTTTNIVNTELNASCTVPWSGAGSSPRCCASDITLAQFKTLKGKMDASNPAATTAAAYLGGTATWRTDLYTAAARCSRSRKASRSISASASNTRRSSSPAIRRASTQVFGSQANVRAGDDRRVQARGRPAARRVAAVVQSRGRRSTGSRNEPAFGKQAVYLDDVDPGAGIPRLTAAELQAIRAQGVRIFAPPIPALLAVDASNNRLVPSQYARDIKAAGLGIITWSFERADLRRGAAFGGFYAAYDPEGRVVKKDSDMYLRAGRAGAGRAASWACSPTGRRP